MNVRFFSDIKYSGYLFHATYTCNIFNDDTWLFIGIDTYKYIGNGVD